LPYRLVTGESRRQTGGEGAAAGQREQLGGELGGEGGDLALEGVDLTRERAAALGEDAGASRLDPFEGRERLLETGEPAGAVESPDGDLEGERQLVQVPAEALLDARAFADQVGAVVGQQPQLALGALEAGLGQTRFAQGGAGHAGGVDRSALATASGASARRCHELRRHAHAALAGGDEEALEASGDVAAVRDGEAALGAETAGPDDELLVAALVGRHGELAEQFGGGGLEADDGVTLLVRVDPE